MMPVKKDCALILAAAGSGSRFGSDTPKQFLPLDGKPVYLRALEVFLDRVGQIVLVVPHHWIETVHREISHERLAAAVQVVPGGETRQDSVGRGLKIVSPERKIVLVHDAARPFVTGGLVDRIVQGTFSNGACIPVLPVSDTVKEIRGKTIVRTIPRESLGLAQTPQGFQVELLRRAYDNAVKKGFDGTDEASLVEHLGESVTVVPGETENRKVTWSGDLC